MVFMMQIFKLSNALSKIIKEKEASFTLQVQLDIATSILSQLKNQDSFEILPGNIGISDISINELLTSYNTLVIETK